MLPEIRLRDATVSDCQMMSDIYNHYVLHDTCTYTEVAETLAERIDWFQAHGPSHPVIIADIDGQVAGWASLSRFRERSAYRFSVEDSVYLRPDMRGRGLGTVMLTNLVARARDLKHRAIIAGISAEQTASIKLHAKFGFVHVAHLREVGFKFNTWLDVIYMELLLR